MGVEPPVAGAARMTRETAALLAAAATGVQVGAALLVTRAIVGEGGPVSLAAMRYAIGVAILLPFAFRRPWRGYDLPDLAAVCLLRIGQFAVLVALLNYAVQHIAAGRAALIFATLPLMTMAIAVAVGRESFTWRRAARIALTVAAVGCSVGGSAAFGAVDAADWPGFAAAGLSALTGAVCSVYYRPYLQRHDTVQVGFIAMAASALVLAVLAAPEGLYDDWRGFSAGGWAGVLFIGASSGAGYLTWLFALRHAPASNVTVFLGLSPIAAGLLGWLFLGEPPTAADGLGVVLLGAGLVLALRPGRPAEPR